MPVRFYSFGKAVGGTESGGSAISEAVAAYGPPETFEGNLGAGITTINFTRPTKHVTIRNLDDMNNIEYRLGSETEWLLLGATAEMKELINVSTIYLRRAAAGTPAYEVIGILTD